MATRQDGHIYLTADEPRQFFDMLDPFPFGERGLDGDVAEYVCERAEEIGHDAPLAISIHLPAPMVDTPLAQSIPAAFHHHFQREVRRHGHELGKLFSLGRKTLLIGLFVLGLCLVVGQALVNLYPDSRIAEVVMEGLVILGWVANWRPMEIFLFDWWPLVKERRLYQRLADAQVSIVPKEAPASSPI